MKVALYHAVDSQAVDGVLKHGIKRGSHGAIIDSKHRMIHTFLDTHLPEWARDHGLSRGSAVCGLLRDEDRLNAANQGYHVVRVNVDSERCFVSDMDLYDTLIRAMELDEMDSTREHLADRYWQRIIPLTEFEPGSIERPEVLINMDISPEDIEMVAKPA